MNDNKLLLGELKEFKRQTISELHEIRKDVRSLMGFKYKLIGGAMISSFLATIVVELLRH